MATDRKEQRQLVSPSLKIHFIDESADLRNIVTISGINSQSGRKIS